MTVNSLSQHGSLCMTLCLWQLFLLLLLLLSPAATAVKFNPCSDIEPINKGAPLVVGLVYWPGGLLSEWGSPETGLNPCNAEVQSNLTAAGAMFATFSTKADRLTVLKTSFPEELLLTGKAPPSTPKVISLVAFRHSVRSDARYVASFEPAVTSGTGFVGGLSLIAKLELGTLKYLQWYNQTCNDCGGRTSTRCLNNTSCAMSLEECSCPNATPANNTTSSSSNTSSSSSNPAPSPSPLPASSPAPAQGVSEVTTPTCSYANFSFCATGVTLSFEGTDVSSSAFATAGQVKKLNSFSLLSLYFVAKQSFFNVKDLFVDKTGEYWGKFGAVQGDIQQAYSGNAAANVDAASQGLMS